MSVNEIAWLWISMFGCDFSKSWMTCAMPPLVAVSAAAQLAKVRVTLSAAPAAGAAVQARAVETSKADRYETAFSRFMASSCFLYLAGIDRLLSVNAIRRCRHRPVLDPAAAATW